MLSFFACFGDVIALNQLLKKITIFTTKYINNTHIANHNINIAYSLNANSNISNSNPNNSQSVAVLLL